MTEPDTRHDRDARGQELVSGRYTMAEAARVKGVSYHTVSRAVRSGKLPAQRLGRMALIDANDLRSWYPMRERAPRKYRQGEGNGTPRQRPVLAECAVAERPRNQLATAISTLHEGAANRNIEGFGDWLASLTASLLSLSRVVIWRVDDTSGRLYPMGAVGVEKRRLSGDLPTSVHEVMRRLIERDEIQYLDPMMVEELSGHAWISPQADADSVIAIPCRQGTRALGLILGVTATVRDEDVWSAEQLGSQAAIAIERVELRRSTRQPLVSSPALFDDLPLQVMAIDRLGHIAYLNNEAARQWGDVVRDRYAGRHYSHLLGLFRRERLDGSVLRVEDHPLSRALCGEHVVEMPVLVPEFFTGPRIFSLSSRPLRDSEGEISGAVLVSRDITVERQAADGGTVSLELLADARRKVTLLGTLSTEIGRGKRADDVFEIVAKRVCEALGADSSVVLVPNSGSGMVVRALHRVSGANLELGRELHRLEVPSSMLAMAQRDVIFVDKDDAGPSGRILLAEGNARSAVMIPLLNGDDVLGVVTVLFSDPTQPYRVDRDFAGAIGRQCGHAVYLRDVILKLEAGRQRLQASLDQIPRA